MRTLPLLLALAVLAACAAPPAATPTPPEPLVIARTPALRPLNPALESCAAESGSLLAILDRLPIQFEDTPATLFVRMGLQAQWPGPVYPIGAATLALALAPENPVRWLTMDDIRGIFSGAARNWTELGGEEIVIQPWALADGGDLQTQVDEVVLGGAGRFAETRLAGSVEQILLALMDDPAAAAILPVAWLGPELNSIPLGVSLPLLVHSPAEPEGEAARWLACLQSESGQAGVQAAFP